MTSTPVEATTITVGGLYRIDSDSARARGTWRVEKLFPKNARLINTKTSAAVVCNKTMLIPVDTGVGSGAEVTVEPLPDYFVIGQTVKVQGRGAVYVVLKPTPRGYSVARLGGDRDQYVNAPTALLTPVKISYQEDQS